MEYEVVDHQTVEKFSLVVRESQEIHFQSWVGIIWWLLKEQCC